MVWPYGIFSCSKVLSSLRKFMCMTHILLPHLLSWILEMECLYRHYKIMLTQPIHLLYMYLFILGITHDRSQAVSKITCFTKVVAMATWYNCRTGKLHVVNGSNYTAKNNCNNMPRPHNGAINCYSINFYTVTLLIVSTVTVLSQYKYCQYCNGAVTVQILSVL